MSSKIYPRWADGSELISGSYRKSSSTFGYRPSNPNRVSFIPIGPEFVGIHDNNATASNMPATGQYFNRILSCRFFNDHSQVLAVDGKSYGTPTGTFSKSSGFSSRNGSAATLGTPAAGNVYTEVGEGGSGHKYDLYCTKDAISSPMGIWYAFENTGSPAGDGSNCVGIIASRIRVYVPAGGTINVTTDESIGMVGTVTSFGFSTAVGSTMGGTYTQTQSNYVQPQTRYYPAWGSTENGLHSFGTACLHSQVWDAWPESCTLMLGQYFCPLHVTPDFAGTNLDVEEPNKELGFVVTSSNAKETSDSVITNTGLRGQLVTGGYSNAVKSCGINDGYEIARAGKGFVVGDKLTSSEHGIELEVTSVSGDGEVSHVKIIDEKRGKLDPLVFSGDSGFSLNFKSASASKACKITWDEGLIYQNVTLEGPLQRAYIKRLSIRADGTFGVREGTKTSNLAVIPNEDAPLPGAYDIFFFFHSDAGINPRQKGFGQQTAITQSIRHITIEIN